MGVFLYPHLKNAINTENAVKYRYSAEIVMLIPYYPRLYTHLHFHLTLNSIVINLIPILVNLIGYSYLRCKFNRVYIIY